MNRVWRATLNSRSQRYEAWKAILESEDVLLKSPFISHAELGPDKDVPIYLLDISKLDPGQIGRLVAAISSKFGATESEVESDLLKAGVMIIREEDVFVAFDMRAFL